jgi:XTP/dITP diphosphohydrolase
MKKILFATTNLGKVKEVNAIFNEVGIEVVSLYGVQVIPKIIEYGLTFEDNAKIKAKTVFDAMNVPVIADDSGLVVDQLGGRPGVHSARFAGENATDEMNNKKLVEELKNVSQPYKAKFVCSSVYYNGKDFIVSNGEMHGEMVLERRGVHGFGYDPYFVPNGFKKTSAELNLEEKNKISHRAKAFRSLVEIIKINF